MSENEPQAAGTTASPSHASDAQHESAAAAAASAKGENVSEEEARNVAEASREKEWKAPSFMRELFLGNFRFDILHPFPEPDASKGAPDFEEWFERFKAFMRDKVDSLEIDASGEYPQEVLDGLKELGAFGMKVPREYGGLGLTQSQYDRIIQYLGSCDGNIGVLLSAHQSIGVPQPVKLFGTKELKEKYLPRIAKGAITAFALTETGVGSDPARLSTTAELSEDGEHYIMNGAKLWCTNGTIADLLVVMARDPHEKDKRKAISAFVVETGWEGVEVAHRCRFMGLKALANGLIHFNNVKVPKENLIGEKGAGLKYALITLNTGRLSLPASSVGTARQCLEVVRTWSNERVQWGQPIGKHEAISMKISEMAATTFAMQAVSELASAMADNERFDIRLEAAATKEWNTARAWEIADDTMQIRGGRGYETELSLKGRGETPMPVERIMRDIRINKLIEGSSEVMHLFMAREAVDKHLQVAEIMIKPDVSFVQKLAAMPKIGWFYAKFMAGNTFRWGRWPKYKEFGEFAGILRYCERTSRMLARTMVWAMMRYRAKLQVKQGFLFRVVDMGSEVYAMAATVAKVLKMRKQHDPQADKAAELAKLFCRLSMRKVEQLKRELWRNEDERLRKFAKSVLAGDHTWLETNIHSFPKDLPATGDMPGGTSETSGSQDAGVTSQQSAAATSGNGAATGDGYGSASIGAADGSPSSAPSPRTQAGES